MLLINSTAQVVVTLLTALQTTSTVCKVLLTDLLFHELKQRCLSQLRMLQAPVLHSI